MKKHCAIALVFLVLGLGGAADAAPITLTFDELTTRPVQGLTFGGITFGFTVGGQTSQDAVYNRPGPGAINFVQGAVLEGDANGVLTLNFAAPTTTLGFGLALTTQDVLTPAVTVQLFGANLQPLGTFTGGASPITFFSEGRFTYPGAQPISRAVIDFDENFSGPVRRFALDNLTYEPVPEPATLVLLGTGLGGVAVGALKRRRNSKAE